MTNSPKPPKPGEPLGEKDALRSDLISFIRAVNPTFKIGLVHYLIAGALDRQRARVSPNLRIHMPPRFGKSLMVSTYNPAFHLGHFPGDKILQVGHEVELSRDYGREVRNILSDEVFRWAFNGIYVRQDSKAAGRWHTNFGGQYIARSVRAGMAGRGGDMGIMDDPISEQSAWSDNEIAFINRWYGTGFTTRLQPDAMQTLMLTRWRTDDLAGHVEKLARMSKRLIPWEEVRIPALATEEAAEQLNRAAMSWGDDRRIKRGDSTFPELWETDELLRKKDGMSSSEWQAQYQQDPVADEGAILKRAWWRPWEQAKPPDCELLIQVYDTAFEENESADFTARTTWGVFRNGYRHNVILLEAWREQIGFPELRKKARQTFLDWEPDRILIEKKASGHSLIQEMRRKGLPVTSWPRGKYATRSKTARAHAASAVLEQGGVWYMPRAWADDVIDECAKFPVGEHDDWVDTCTACWLYLRKTYWLDIPDDDRDEDRRDRDFDDNEPRMRRVMVAA